MQKMAARSSSLLLFASCLFLLLSLTYGLVNTATAPKSRANLLAYSTTDPIATAAMREAEKGFAHIKAKHDSLTSGLQTNFEYRAGLAEQHEFLIDKSPPPRPLSRAEQLQEQLKEAKLKEATSKKPAA